MSVPLRVLLVEDSQADADALEQYLRYGDYAPLLTRVQTLEDFRSALSESEWDIVISDHRLSACNGLEVLDVFNASGLDIPFILMSGAMGEDIAAEAMVRGAHDCVLKDRPTRLLPAIARELTATHVWREKQESDRRFSVAIQNAEVGYFRIGADGRFQQVNQAWLRMHGYDSADEVLGQTYVMTQVANDLSAADAVVAKLLRGEPCSGDFSRRRKDGTIGYHTFSITPIMQGHEVVAFEGFLIDTTERRRSEEALKESQEKYREIFEVTTEALILVEVESGRCLEANSAACEMYGFGREEILTKCITDLSTESEKTREATLHVQPGHPQTAHRLHKRKNGTVFPVEISMRHFLWGGRAVEVVAIRDITDRKRAEDELRKFRTVCDTANYGVLILGLEGTILYTNPSIAESHGYTCGEVTGHPFAEFISPEDADIAWQSLREVLEKGAVPLTEIAALCKDGTKYPALASATLVRDDMGKPQYIAASLVDISERRQLEDQLRQAQKMEAVGQLAGGIAHDFNNMLAVILGYSDLLLTRPGDCPPNGREPLQQIHKAAERAKQVAAQLLAFSRKQVLEVRPLDVNQIITDFEKMLERLIGEDIAVVTSLSPDLGTVMADASQIGQILINLAVNARDAMPDGGTLTIETEKLTIGNELAPVYPAVPAGSYVVFSVTDTGCGMSHEIRDHMFEPFFTTKRKGKGTGLGLATVYGIVKQHDGEITVQSAPGAGSTFRVFLPCRTGEPETQGVSPDKGSKPCGSETVLVTEDDDSLRALVCRVLEHLGYRALEAVDGQDAVRVATECDNIRLLLTDVVMPDMNGREVADRVLAVRPEIRVLYMSGYADDILADKGTLAQGVHLIKKPFSAAGLDSKIREILAT